MQSQIFVLIIPAIAVLFGLACPNFPVPAGIIVGVWLVKTYDFIHGTGD